jgi:hypothetical protein
VLDIFGRMEGRHFRVCGPVWYLHIDWSIYEPLT